MRIATMHGGALDRVGLIHSTMQALGHECCGYEDAGTLLSGLHQENHDLLILDGDPASRDGLDTMKRVRESPRLTLPVLFVTERCEDTDMIEALDAGADDFIAGPVSRSVLAARVQALLRRSGSGWPTDEVTFGCYCFRVAEGCVHVDGEPVVLKSREFQLALFLFQNLGHVVRREYLYRALWGLDDGATTRSLDTHICHVRTKLALRSAKGFRLSTVYGFGYRLDPANVGTAS